MESADQNIFLPNPQLFDHAHITSLDEYKALPKTRSGKIMRRILRKIAAMQIEDLGDITTLADPSVVASLIELRMNMGK